MLENLYSFKKSNIRSTIACGKAWHRIDLEADTLLPWSCLSSYLELSLSQESLKIPTFFEYLSLKNVYKNWQRQCVFVKESLFFCCNYWKFALSNSVINFWFPGDDLQENNNFNNINLNCKSANGKILKFALCKFSCYKTATISLRNSLGYHLWGAGQQTVLYIFLSSNKFRDISNTKLYVAINILCHLWKFIRLLSYHPTFIIVSAPNSTNIWGL